MKTDKITNRRGCRQFIKSLIINNSLYLLLLVTITYLFTGTAFAQTWRLAGPPEFVLSQDDPARGGIFQPGTSRKSDVTTTTLNSRTANSAAFTTTNERWGTGRISYSWDSPPEVLHSGDIVAFTIRWNMGQKYSDFCPQMGTLVHLDMSEDWYTTQWYGYSNHPVSPASGQESNTVIKVTSNNPTNLVFYVDVHSSPGDVRVQWTYRRVDLEAPPATTTTSSPAVQSVSPPAKTTGSVNLALNKPTKQSSSAYGGNAARTVDGVKDGGYGFHTDKENSPWWQVDLGALKSLGEIHIFNRRDCCSERARTIQVLLSDDGVNWKKVFSNPGTVFGTDGKPLRVSVKGLSARYVRLQLTEAAYFHLDEVEVYGSDIAKTPPDLSGVWYDYSASSGNSGLVCKITQTGEKLVFTNPFNNQSEGNFLDNSTIIATTWQGGLKATLEDEGQRIVWKNGSVWQRSKNNTVKPPPVTSLTGAWVHSADRNFHTDDGKVIVIQDGNQVTMTQTYKVSDRWVTLVCQGSISGQDLQMQLKWAPGGNPFGYANTTLNLKVSSDGNHLDGVINPNTGNSQESHYSRIR